MQKKASQHPPLRVFVSHKHHDGPEVMNVVTELKRYARNRRLECFVSDYHIRSGQDWRQRIRMELRRSNMLLLLYTDPGMNWDWCLYEAGLFTRLDAEQVKPVVCIYAGNRPPGPLHNVKGVPAADIGEVTRFLKTFYTTTDLFVSGYRDPDHPDASVAWDSRVDDEKALNAKIRVESLKRLAKTIGEKFGQIRPAYPCHRLVLEMPKRDGESKTTLAQDLSDAEVVDSTATTLKSIFGRDPDDLNLWGDLVDSVDPERPQRWARELAERLEGVAAGNIGDAIFDPITTTFRGRDGRLYCPELYRVDLPQESGKASARGPTEGAPAKPATARVSRVVIIFDSLSAPTVVGDTVFNLIRANFRFRDEVFAPYCGQLAARIDEERRVRGTSEEPARSAVFERLDEALSLIEHEADVHRFFDEERLAQAYGKSTARWKEVRRLGELWEAALAGLQRAIGGREVEPTERSLAELARITWEFSVIAGQQHLEMMQSAREEHARSAPGWPRRPHEVSGAAA